MQEWMDVRLWMANVLIRWDEIAKSIYTYQLYLSIQMCNLGSLLASTAHGNYPFTIARSWYPWLHRKSGERGIGLIYRLILIKLSSIGELNRSIGRIYCLVNWMGLLWGEGLMRRNILKPRYYLVAYNTMISKGYVVLQVEIKWE